MVIEPKVIVLNVDSDESGRRATSHILKGAGIEVVEAATGAEALKLAGQGPDLVVLNVKLPDIDGFEVCRQLRAGPATERIPVLHLSAACDGDVALVDGLETGIDGYLRQPVEPVVLISCVGSLLRVSKTEMALEEKEQYLTDLKLVDEALSEEIRIKQTLLDAMPCIAMLMRPGTREIVTSNQAAAKVGAVAGKTCWATWGRRDAPCPWCLAPEVWAGKKDQHLEVEYLGVVWDAHWHYVSDDLCLHYAFDITDRRQLEDALRQAQKMEAIGRLAGGVAHDFRNQLTVIKGFAEILMLNLGDDARRQEIQEILDAANRATVLTAQLLAFSRKEILSPAIVNLGDLIEDLAKPLVRIIGEDVRLKITPAGKVDKVKVDPGQFQQAIMNLAVNARDAMPDGGELTITTANAEPDDAFLAGQRGASADAYVVVTVTDTGAGMDVEAARRIFEPFYTTKPVGEGTGLGLSMVYGFVTQSGGYVNVDSEPESGTTFTIYLPCVSETPADDVEEAPEATVDGDKRPRGTGTIMVTEDEEAVRQFVVRSLRESGYTVLETSNAAEAVPLGEHYAEPIDLLITDVVMPGMNGSELARRLKSIRPEMRIMFISGYAGSSAVRQDIFVDGAELLVKPFGGEQLLAAVHHVLE